MRNINTPASEEPIDLATLDALKSRRHYGWSWSGPEVAVKIYSGSYERCQCEMALCGLISLVSAECGLHSVTKLGSAKQVHWAKDCPA